MFKSARSRLRAAVFACAAALGLGAYAAPTATAVWRSNLGQSYTIGGNTYGVTIPGNETKQAGVLNADGTITVANEWTGFSSPYIGLSSANPTAVSMLVKFSGLSIPESDATGVCLAAMRDSSGNEVGAVVKASSTSLKAYYMGNTATTTTEGDVTGGENVMTQSGYMLFSYSTAGGVKIYVGSDIASLAGGAMGSYKYGSNTIERFSIGGDPAGKVYTPSGMIIEEVALFVGSALTNTDVADYAFPTLDGETTALTMTELNTKIAADSKVFFTASPVVTLDVEPSDATKTYLQSTAWNGTVFIKDADKTDIVPTAYGNPNSTLKLSGVKGYFAARQFNSSATPAIELEDSATEGRVYGLYLNNGYSFESQGAYYWTQTPELKGSGTLKADSSGAAVLVVVDKWDNFTGKLELTNKAVYFGTGIPERAKNVVTAGTIKLNGTVPASIGTWTVGTAFTGSVLTLTTAANATTTAFLTDSTKWKGTCQLNWNHTSALDIVNYGNANSVVEIVSTFSAYPTKNGGSAAANLAAELKLSANWTVANGWDSMTTTFAKLSGTGNLIVNGASGGSTAIPYTITKIENFTGALGGARGQFTIGTIVASEEPVGGTKLVSLSNCTKTPVLNNTTVEYNGAAVEGITLEVKSDGIYVAVPATTVDITIPEVDNATVSVTTNGVAVTPVNGVVTVDIGATVVVTYTADEGYQLTGDAISFTASASTTTVDVSSISVAAIVANVTSADGQTTTPYTSAASAIAAADNGETVTLLEATVTLTEVVAINKSITILSGNASGTTITGLNTSAYPTLGAADLTLGANVTVSAQLRVLSGEATITHPTASVPSYRPPTGYMSSSKNNGDDTTTITFYQQVYVYAAGTNATLADENGNQFGSFTLVAPGDTFVFTVTPAAGCALVRVTADGVELTPSEGKYSISIGSSNVSIYAVAGVAVVTGGDSDVYCSSLQAAVNAATSGQTVKLLSDTTEAIEHTGANAFTLDMNGHNWTVEADCDTVWAAFKNNGGAVTFKDSVGTGAMRCDAGFCIWARTGSVVIQSGNYYNNSNNNYTLYLGTNDAGLGEGDAPTMTISGGTFVNENTEAYIYKTSMSSVNLNVFNYNASTASKMATTLIQVTGGSFTCDPALGDDNMGGTFVAAGYESTEDNGVWVVAALPNYTVTFDADGGTPAPAAQTVQKGSTATEPKAPTKADYTFAGWTLGGSAYDFATPVTSNITLVASWTPSGINPADPTSSQTVTPTADEIAAAGGDAQAAAIAKAAVTVPTEASAYVDADTYKTYFNLTAEAGVAGAYTVTISGLKSTVAEDVDASAAAQLVSTAAEGDMTIAVKPGLYYGFTTGTTLTLAEPELTLATGETRTIAKPGTTQGFIKVKVSATP